VVPAPAGKLNKREARAPAKSKNLVGDFSIGDFLLKTLLASRLVAGDTGQNLQGIGGVLSRHRRFLHPS
jgi:membrane-bound metal-dependent hydrolase YbcI (DUF457 family)